MAEKQLIDPTPLIVAVAVLHQQAGAAIAAGDYDAAGAMLDDASGLCGRIQYRIDAMEDDDGSR